MNTVPRRRLLAMMGSAAAAAVVPIEAANAAKSGVRRLTLQSLHTGEMASETYWEDGRYITDALKDLAILCRDFRTGDIYPIDTDLLDYVHTIGGLLGRGKPIQLISAYRSPKTNARLASRSSGVAKRSLHMQGKAFDIRIPGVPARTVHKAALSLGRGGTGLYSRSNFVHVDVGRVRFWGS